MCFYVQPLKVGSCTNDDKSVSNILLSFSASIQMVLFSESVAFLENHQIWMKTVIFFIYGQYTGISVQ